MNDNNRPTYPLNVFELINLQTSIRKLAKDLSRSKGVVIKNALVQF